jgi:hypothetical protein
MRRMAQGASGFLKDNAFIVAAVALPVLVGAFFVVASAIPRFTVPGPAFDLVLRAGRPYDSVPGQVSVDFSVRDGQVEATVRTIPKEQGYMQRFGLLYLDHNTMAVREIPLDLPTSLEPGEESRTVVIDGLSKVRVSAQTTAPDGYKLETSTSGSPGIVGVLFGIGRYRQGAVLVNRGRIIRIELPSPYQEPYQSMPFTVGWVTEGSR